MRRHRARSAPIPAAARPVLSFEPVAWTCACLALAWWPLAGTTPAWISAAAAAALAIRLALAAVGADAPPAALRLTLAALAIALFFADFHTFNGLTAGAALLVLTAGLKMLEARSTRDLYVVVLIVYFLGLAALIERDALWTLAYLIAVCWLTAAALLRLGTAAHGPDAPASLRYAARAVLQALPVALALWIFFPRLAAPLWRITAPGSAATSGLGDTMDPGDIDELAMSDAIAFHARFLGRTPPRSDLYWRGPVLDRFDGRTWRRDDPGAAGTIRGAPAGATYRYRLDLESYPHDWIYGLDRPIAADAPGARLSGDGVLIRPGRESAPASVVVVSRIGPSADLALNAATRARDTRLPAQGNPRTRALARSLRRAHPRDLDLVAAVLAMFHDQPYYYTLTPPRLGRDPVDAFLFDSRHGFCEHYASAFAVLMRASGIPARVVTGYYGGRLNAYSGEWIVRQRDAHAWDEVWLGGRGWVRVDPTAAIAPQRVDPSLRDASRTPGGFAAASDGDASWTGDLALRLDALGSLWRGRILRYDALAQRALLARLRVPDPDATKLAVALAAALGLGFVWLGWRSRRELAPRPRDPLHRAFATLTRRLGKAGVPRRPHEGPEAYARRVAAARPDLGAAVEALCREYSALRYGDGATERRTRAFRAAVQAFRPRGSRGCAGIRRRPSAPRSARD